MKNKIKSEQPDILGILDTSFRVLAEISPAGIYLTDNSGKWLYVNPAWCRIAGLSAKEAEGDGWISAIHKDDKIRIESEWKRFIRGEIPWESEHRLIDKTGNLTWVYSTATLFKNSAGLVKGIIGIIHDISEKKKFETELKESEEKYRAFFENSMDAIFLTSPDGRIYSANRAACKLFERSEEELCRIGRNGVVDLTDPKLEKALKERAGKGSFFGELRMVKKSGEKFQAEISTAIFSDNEHGQVTTMIIRDITERKISEEKLKASEAEFRSIFENSLMGISQVEPGGCFRRINKAYAEMYGYPDTDTMLSEVSGNTKCLYSDPGERKRVLELLDRSGYMAPAEFKLNKCNGEKFWALVSARQVRDSKGKLLFLQAEHIDITGIKKMDAELRKSKKSLEKLNHHLIDIRENERSQIALNLHDDFGQRLTALNLDIKWLKSRIGVQALPVMKKLNEMSTMINESIESIREIASFLRPAILFDLGLVAAFEWQLNRFIKQSGIRYHFIHEPEEIDIDKNISLVLYRVFQESLTNIARHSGASHVEVKLNKVDRKIGLLISDNGKGINKNEVNSLTSMGITGIKERIRSIGGRLLIKGECGRGTYIKISIPLKKNITYD
jgi:PAS domain S-box-containing protein